METFPFFVAVVFAAHFAYRALKSPTMHSRAGSYTFVLRPKSNVPSAQDLVRLGNAVDANRVDAAR